MSVEHRKKSLLLTIVLGVTPFAFLYLGGWKVGLPILLVAGIFPLLWMPMNLDFSMLPDALRLTITAIMSAVYLYQSLLFRLEYNWVVAKTQEQRNQIREATSLVQKLEGMPEKEELERVDQLLDDPEIVRSFKRGLSLAVSIFHGILLSYVGSLLFWADISRSGEVGLWSVLKATIITGVALYFLNKALSWAGVRLKGYILTLDEFQAYTLIQLYSGSYKYQ